MGAGELRVLHVCAGNLYGGIERIVAECAADRHLCPAMMPVVATCADGRLAGEVRASGARHALLGDARVSRPWTVARARRALRALLSAERPGVVICHSAWVLGLAGPVVRRTGARLALWVHDRVSGRSWPERWAARTRPDLLIANSRFTAASVPALYPGAAADVLYAPVSADPAGGDRGALRASLGADDATPVILVASRFEPWKGHHLLVEALARVPGAWHLWVAGGPQRPEEREREQALRAHVEAAGLAARVRFLGERRDVGACMRAADIHCQPNSGPEPFGLAFVEALYAGLPVVTTAMGGALEIVTPDCGDLVPPGDPAALASALARLVADRDLRARMGAAGPARARALCDPARQIPALAALLGRISPAAVA